MAKQSLGFIGRGGDEHFVIHPAVGGLDETTASTALGISTPGALTIAENIEYDTSGARRKRLGTTRYNSSQVTESGLAVPFTALADFWRYGASRTPTQKFVATAGTGIWKDDGDGVWDNIKTSWGAAAANTYITMGQGLAVFSTDNGTNAPQSWDQTTLQDLAGTPPVFAFSVYHLRRLWAAGIAATPSEVDYTAAGGITTWSGADSSVLIFDEDDGDAVMGISKPFKNRLYVFKGPNIGSVHEISGATFATFARNKILVGAPCVSHGSIITTSNEIYWASNIGFHSLSTTQNYGDTQATFMSKPVQETFRGLNFSRLGQLRGFWHPTRNIVGWLAPGSGQTNNTLVFVYNYASNQWSLWDYSGFDPACVAVMRDPTSAGRNPRLYVGDYTGYVHSGDQITLNDDDGTVAYTAKFRTPVLSRFTDIANEMTEKSFSSVTTFFRPKGAYSATLDVTTDTRTQSALSVSMQGAGAALGTFVLDTDALGANELTYTETPFSDRARSIQLTYSMGGDNQDMEIYGYGLRYEVAESAALEAS